ncbi:hypothetical protein TPENAI_90134 [Tenacibaculum litopenaei]
MLRKKEARLLSKKKIEKGKRNELNSLAIELILIVYTLCKYLLWGICYLYFALWKELIFIGCAYCLKPFR